MKRKDEKPSVVGFWICIFILTGWFIFEMVITGVLVSQKEQTLHKNQIVTPLVMIHSPTPSPTPTNTPTPTSTPTPLPELSEIIRIKALQIVKEQQMIYEAKKEALYNAYSEEELELLFRVVEAEVTGYDVECKSHVASVIFNRINAGKYEGDLTKNLLARRQFAVIADGRYKIVTITESTIKACVIAFHEDTAQGALYFDSTKGKSWAHRNREFVFADAAHWFYK